MKPPPKGCEICLLLYGRILLNAELNFERDEEIMKRKLLSVFLCICMTAMLLPAAVFAEEPTVSVWDGSSVAAAYESGDGTEANPYEIATAEQFAYFAEQIKAGVEADAYYILTGDLDMTAENWYPIGCTWDEYYAGHSFSGNLNGNGHCVAFKIDVPFDSVAETTYRNCGIGLFGISEAVISNLHADGTITMSKRDNMSYYGGICGLYAGNMENCYSDVDITVTEDAGINYSEIGGLIGELQGGTVRNCAFTGQINNAATSIGAYIGGISGYIRSGSIIACKNEGALSGSERNAIGGIVGTGWSNGADVMLIENCYNMGNITQTSDNPVYNNYAGGIAGNMMMGNTSSARLIGCYSDATITASNAVSSSAICPSLSPNGSEGAFYTIENCYYLTGTDDNGNKAADLNEIYEKLSKTAEEGIWVQDENGVPRLYWELVVAPEPATFSVTFQDEDGTILDTISVQEGDDPISLPELKDDDGNRVFIGWWGINSSGSSLYYAGEKYAVTEDATFIAYWDEIITLTAPFTTTVELGDSGVPGETVFTLEIMFMGEVDEDIYQDITISASVTTNGKGDYDGAMTFTGLSQQLKSMLRQGMFVQQTDDGKENWTYDDAVWYLVLADDTEVAAMALSDGVEPEYKILIFRATCEETENGPIYYIDWENLDWDAPEEKMLFTNTYTAHDYTQKYNKTEHWDECDCGDVQNREAHRFGEWTVTKKATETENGEKEHTCTVCGYTQTAKIEKLPAAKTPSNTNDSRTGGTKSPETGNNGNIALWIAAALAAGTALSGTILYGKKKKYSR